MDDWQKRIKKYAFSNGNELVWASENKTNSKMLVWWKILCFDKNGYLKWSGAKSIDTSLGEDVYHKLLSAFCQAAPIVYQTKSLL